MIQDKEIDCVLKPSEGKKGSLYISNLPAAQDVKKLKSLNIKSVITVANINIDMLRDLYKQANINHLIIDIADKRDIGIQSFFDQTYNFIEENLKSHSVLVHCFIGVSRSATIILAYLMRSKLYTYEKALHYQKQTRPDVMPNVGFIQKLLDLQQILIKTKKKKAK